MTLPEVIPLFPLPNVVLFPGMALPLHIFEPRYRAMVRDALRGPRLIGMVLLRGDWRGGGAGGAPTLRPRPGRGAGQVRARAHRRVAHAPPAPADVLPR